MKISILSIFPEIFSCLSAIPVVKRAVDRGLIELEIVDMKNYARGSYRRIDDSPCGGGPGMIIRIDVAMAALNAVRTENSLVVLLTPKGKPYTQKKAHEFAQTDHLILICGHYEGIDARIEKHVDLMLSVGDYVLSGGEVPAITITDSIARLVGTIRTESLLEESHEGRLLEYPQYTKPADYNGDKVPQVLLSGNHAEIEKWRREMAEKITRELRPDLLDSLEVSVGSGN